MNNNDFNLEWLNEKINAIPHNNGLYKFVCFFLGKKKLSYKEMYLILYNINKNKLGEDSSKERCMKEIINLYKFNNNKIPNSIPLYEN